MEISSQLTQKCYFLFTEEIHKESFIFYLQQKSTTYGGQGHFRVKKFAKQLAILVKGVKFVM